MYCIYAKHKAFPWIFQRNFEVKPTILHIDSKMMMMSIYTSTTSLLFLKLEPLFNKLDQVQPVLELWFKQWLGENISWIILQIYLFNHVCLRLDHVPYKVQMNVKVRVVISWYTWWLAKWMSLWLSQCIFTYYWVILNSLITPLNHMASLTPLTRIIYFTWVIGNATINCLFGFQLIFVLSNVNTKPERCLSHSLHP